MEEKIKIGIKGAALKAGMSEKTAHKYLKIGKLPSELKQKRQYSTHQDHFQDHWVEIQTMMQTSGGEFEAKTIMRYLVEKYPESYKFKHLRTLQRRIKQWHGEHGKEKPVIFRQVLVPGRQSQSDWTHMGSVGVTIDGKKFKHLLFHFMLPYSRFETIMVCYSESFDTLSRGFELAVEEVGGLCSQHRTDNLSAATKASGGNRLFTSRWLSFLGHYGIPPTRNNPGVSHENGSVEKSHDLFKKAVVQHLLLRGSKNFANLKDYETFLNKLKDQRNADRIDRFREEQKVFKSLPPSPYNAVDLKKVKVNSASVIRLQNTTYSVPSRLIGHWLDAYIFRDNIELYLGKSKVITLPKTDDGIAIDYRHIIDSLIRKPGAFENYKYKACLYPNVSFRRAYDVLKTNGSSPSKQYLELLKIAKMEGEEQITCAIDLLLEAGATPDKIGVLTILNKSRKSPEVHVQEPILVAYDGLLDGSLNNLMIAEAA